MPKFEVADGRIVRGWTVRLDPTPEQARQLARDCGARRYAYNWAVTQIGASFEAGRQTGEWDPVIWNARALRTRWNQVKGEMAPWWPECSKEAYATGIADAVVALSNWKASKDGTRKGPKVRFPKRKKKTRDRRRCTYTTGALRVADVRTVVLPRVGAVRSAENLRPLWRHIRRGTGRILAATVRENAGHWSVSLRLEIVAHRQPAARHSTVGVDVGIGDDLLIVMRPDGTVVEKVPNPKALRVSLAELRHANRALSRKVEGSTRWWKAKRRVARTHSRVVNVRADALHKATTDLTKTHGEVVIEDLAVRQLCRGIRRHRKAWTDVAAGELRRQLIYKAEWYGSTLWVADRWYPSSKTCSACGHVNRDLTMADRAWSCPECGATHDRDENAGINLARLPASWAEAQSNRQTTPGSHVAVKRVNHPRRVAA